MQVRVYPSVPRGSVTVPPSKSLAHRAIICACLADGISRLHPIAYSKDILATIGCMRTLGAQITELPDSLEIRGVPSLKAKGPLFLDCCESGSTLRFLIPLASLTGSGVVFTGQGRLLSRPQSVYETLFAERRLAFSHQPERLTLRGTLSSGDYHLRGDVSSQFITGLLFTLPLLEGDSDIRIDPPFESRSYIELTLQTLAQFGVKATFTDPLTLHIPGGQHYQPCDAVIEGDYSQAAFFAVLGAVGGEVSCLGLSPATKQGDAVILEILKDFGAAAIQEKQSSPSSTEGGHPPSSFSFVRAPLTGRKVDLADCPDLGPILTVLAAYAEGETTLLHAGRLRIKESDRGAAMEQELSALGVDIHREGDSIRIRRGQSTSGEKRVCSHNDHRVAMSLAVFAACGGCPVIIDGAECVQKSYPDFWQELQGIGVQVEELVPHSDLKAEALPIPATASAADTGENTVSDQKILDKRYLIVGLGLIGGSYAMALSRRGYEVTAIDINPDSIDYAKEKGLIKAGAVSAPATQQLIGEADVIIMGLYPTAMVRWVTENQGFFRPGILLTDVSGVKRTVLKELQEKLRPDVEFIASHPMAGRELSGVRNSDDRIFQGANFILTPTSANTPEAVAFGKALGEALGFCRISLLSPEEHDQMIGYLSQLTHAIAVSLMNANGDPNLVKYTGDSFRDLTRIARINEALWSELFQLNQDYLIPEIDSFIKALEDLKEKLAKGDEEGLKKLFIQSTQRRRQFDRSPNEGQ